MSIDTAVALISLDEAKEQLKITGSNEDAVVGNFVNAVSGLVNKYVGRTLLTGAHVEYYDGDGSRELVLKHTPVTAVTAIYNGCADRVFDDTNKLDSSKDYVLNKNAGIVTLIPETGKFGVFVEGKANVKASYTGGYTLATMPYDLRLAVRVWLGTVYMKYFNRRYEFLSANTGMNSATFIEKDMPVDVKAILDRYRDQVGLPNFSHED